IIAHEMAHIINGDTSDNASLHRSIQRMAQLHRGLETASQLSKLRVSKDYVVSEVTEEHEISIRALNASDRLQSISSTIAKPVWRNEQEEAADGLAVRMMLKAGFRPSGAIAAFKSFAEGREKACAELVAVNETVDDVIAAARDYGVATLLTGQSVSLQDVLDPLEKRANRRLRVAFMAAALPSVYASPAEREELVRDFLSTDEGKALLSESRTNRASDQGTLAYRDSAAHAAVTASLEASYEVERALSSSHVDEAKASLSKVNMQSSHGRLLKRRVRRMQGQFDTGSDNLVLALNLSRSAKPYGEPPAVEVFELRAYDLLSAGLKEDAAALVARGAEQFADEKHFLPEHIFLAAVDDDATNLGDLEMSCTSAPRSDLWPICEAAATGFRPDFRLSAEEILTLSGAKSGQRPADRIKDGINILQRTIIQQ
ncbi:MAG: M48 family metalloprotease, partial [Pseudomonadota bacterium]